MPEIIIDPVLHITADAFGKPGARTFFIQASGTQRVVTLLVEKVQLQTLAVGVEQFLEEIYQRFPNLPSASDEFDEDRMHILPPVDPSFRVGDMGLSYIPERDLMVLVLREGIFEESEDGEVGEEPEAGIPSADTEKEGDEDKGMTARFFCTRPQLRALTHWSVVLANRGRPICPQCGQPMEPEGHFCPKKNGHKH